MVRDEIQIKAELDFAVEQAEAKGKAEGMAKGKAEGKAEGFVANEAKGKAEIAKAMKEDGLDPEMIARYSGLTIEIIEKL